MPDSGTRTLLPGPALQEGWLIFRHSFKYCLPLALLFAMSQALAFAGYGMARTNPLGWLLYIVAAVGSGASAAAMTMQQQVLVSGAPLLTPFAALQRGLAAMPVWLIVSVITWLLPTSAVTLLRSGGGGSALLAAVLVVPTLIFSVSLQLGIPVVAAERPGVWPALLRSHRLVWGNWWRTLLALALVLVFVVASLIVMVMMLALVAGAVAGPGALQGTLRTPLTALIYVLVAIVLLPGWSAVTLALYRQLTASPAGATPLPPASPPDTPAGEAR